MFMKASYILASTAAIGLMFFAAPRGGPLTSSPERGKVERKTVDATPGNATVRMPMFVFLGGYQGGK